MHILTFQNALDIAEHFEGLGKVVQVEERTFPDGEVLVRVPEAGPVVVLVARLYPGVNDSVFKLFLALDALNDMFDNSAPTLVFTTAKAPAEKIVELRARGVEVYVADGEKVDPAWVLSTLYQRGVRKVLLEGGGRTNWEFLHRCLVDEVVLTITPYIFGRGVSLVEGEGYPTKEDMSL